MTTYPINTPITSIKNFDRSTKVHFKCIDHANEEWVSKDPYVSNWFPANEYTIGINSLCTMDKYITASEYKS